MRNESSMLYLNSDWILKNSLFLFVFFQFINITFNGTSKVPQPVDK